MIMTKKVAAISVALVVGQALAASAPAQTQGSEQRRICRSTQTTATRMGGSRICKTAAEWREIDRMRERERDAEGDTFRTERVASQPITTPAPN
jgi:hypothetical protein